MAPAQRLEKGLSNILTRNLYAIGFAGAMAATTVIADDNYSKQMEIREFLGRDSFCLKGSIVATFISKKFMREERITPSEVERVEYRRITAVVQEKGITWQASWMAKDPYEVCGGCGSLDKLTIVYASGGSYNQGGYFAHVDIPVRVLYQGREIYNYAKNLTCNPPEIRSGQTIRTVRPLHYTLVSELSWFDMAKVAFKDARAVRKE
jgi:hypothetical protein